MRTPHCGQNEKVGAHMNAQLGHARGCFAPHCGQNAKSFWIWKPQLPQTINLNPINRSKASVESLK
jgi:hypothetical protein